MRECVCVWMCMFASERGREREKRMMTGMMGGEWKGEHIEEESISRDQHRGLCIPCEQVSRFS